MPKNEGIIGQIFAWAKSTCLGIFNLVTLPAQSILPSYVSPFVRSVFSFSFGVNFFSFNEPLCPFDNGKILTNISKTFAKPIGKASL